MPGFDGVWAIGDAAAVPDPARPGEPCPPTAQHAMRQGRTVAKNIVRAIASRKPKPFRYKTLGVFVDMGRYQAVAETLGIRWRGFPAWLLARTYHLAQMPGYKRRLRITVDWTVDLLFRRDSSELGQLGHPPRLGEDASGQEAAGLRHGTRGRRGREAARAAVRVQRRGRRGRRARRASSQTRSSEKRIVKVCTLRQRGISSACVGRAVVAAREAARAGARRCRLEPRSCLS